MVGYDILQEALLVVKTKMSSILTEDLFDLDENICTIIDDVVKSVEERTYLRQRRSIAVKVKLQEMNDRKNKLAKARLDRLASKGVFIDIDGIRTDVKQTNAQKETSNSIQSSNIISMQANLKTFHVNGSSLDDDVQRNIEEHKRLNQALQNLQNFNREQYDKDSKHVKPNRRKSIASVSAGSGLPLETRNQITAGRRMSVSNKNHESVTIKRRNSVGGLSDRIKTKGHKKTLKPIEDNDFKKMAAKIKNALKVK